MRNIKKDQIKQQIDAYHDSLRDAKRFYAKLLEVEKQKRDLLAVVKDPNLKKIEVEISRLEDQHRQAKIAHKECLDRLIVVCETRLRAKEQQPEKFKMYYSDLVDAGFNFARHGVDHPLLLKLDKAIRNDAEFKVEERKVKKARKMP